MTAIGNVYTIQFFTHKTVGPFHIVVVGRRFCCCYCLPSHTACCNRCENEQLEGKACKYIYFMRNIFIRFFFSFSFTLFPLYFIFLSFHTHCLYVPFSLFQTFRKESDLPFCSALVAIFPSEQCDPPTGNDHVKEKSIREMPIHFIVYINLHGPRTGTQQASALIMKI